MLCLFSQEKQIRSISIFPLSGMLKSLQHSKMGINNGMGMIFYYGLSAPLKGAVRVSGEAERKKK